MTGENAMMLIRPVRLEECDEVLALAKHAGTGMTSLPQDAQVMKRKIERSVGSFARHPEYDKDEVFLFVLEDTASGKLAGTAALVSHVGMKRPFYSYKLSTIVQASAGLNIYLLQRVLHMVNDYTGASEIGSLFLLPQYRRDGLGKFLSRFRYLMLAEFPEVFSDLVISEIRGVQDGNGESPFYNNLAKHFFLMDFKRADYVYATQGGQFIADLMPKYPIYVNLLARDAQDTIGVPFQASKPAMQLLEAEGFTHQGYVDVFDAGPTMQANRRAIRTVKKSRRKEIVSVVPRLEDAAEYMIASTRISDFRAVRGGLVETEEGGVVITMDAAKLLNVRAGDTVRYAL